MKTLPNWYVVRVTFFVSLGGILTGSAVGSLNGVLEMKGFKAVFSQLYTTDSEEEDYNRFINDSSQIDYNQTRTCSSGSGSASVSWIGILVSSVNIGGFCGSVISGWIADRFSRKYGLLMSGLLFLFGSCLLSASFYLWMILIGRLLCGTAMGMIYMIGPIYMSEVSPKEFRGIFTSLIGLMFNAGFLLSLGVNAAFAKFYLGWRIVFSTGILQGLVYVIGMKFMPNTPRWLVMKGWNHDALLVLSKINRSSCQETTVDTFFELEELKNSVIVRPNWREYCSLIAEWKYRLLLMSTLFFLATSQGAFIFYYTTTIFCEVGINAFNSALIVGLVVLVASLTLTFFIDKIGRKKLLLICTSLMFVLILTLAILLQLFRPLSGVLLYISVIFLCLYAFGDACSWLTVSWVINSEIFPTTIRGMTVMISTGCFWFFASVVTQLIPLLIGSPLQLHGFFYILAGLATFAFFLVLFILPETKGVSLEYMDAQFSQSIWERFIATFRYQSHSSDSIEQIQEKKLNFNHNHESNNKSPAHSK